MSFAGEEGTSVRAKFFISEAEIEARNKKRQEEWEKVRKPEDPEEVPEEEFDPRSLFDRLQEQKDKRQAEYEESHRLKNLIKGLDDDEVSFLELVDQTKIDIETKLWNEEMQEIQKFKEAVSNLTEEESEARLKELRKNLNIKASNPPKKSQQSLLAEVMKRKSQQSLLVGAVKRKTSTSNGTEPEKKLRLNSDEKEADVKSNMQSSSTEHKPPHNIGSLQCLGVLPGLGMYTDSSDSDNSSISENEKEDYDLIGRVKVEKPIPKTQS